jgi:RND family efflux transporter MFP subunit
MVALLLAIVCVGCRHSEAGSGEEEKEEKVSVSTQPVERRTIAQLVYGLGTCEALIDKSATLSPAVEGQVAEILVKQGEQVKAGQPIVQLNARVAEANYQEKKRTREGLEASLRLLKALPRAEEQNALRLAIDEAKTGVQKAESVVARLQPLLDRHEIPQQQMLEAKLALDQARVQRQKAESQLAIAMLGPRPEAVEEAQSRITTAAAAEESAKAQRDLHTVRAPIDGVLDKLICRLGQTLTVGTPIGEIVDSHALYATVWIPPRNARWVMVGQSASVQAADAPRAGKAAEKGEADSLAGRVAFVGQNVDPQTGNLPVRVLVENGTTAGDGGRAGKPVLQLRPGQTVAVHITVLEKPGVLAVPSAAIFDLEEGPALSVIRDGKAVVLHPRLGIKDKEWAEVEGVELKPGEPAIIEGGWNLSDGTAVEEKSGEGEEDEHGDKEHADKTDKTESHEASPEAKT